MSRGKEAHPTELTEAAFWSLDPFLERHPTIFKTNGLLTACKRISTKQLLRLRPKPSRLSVVPRCRSDRGTAPENHPCSRQGSIKERAPLENLGVQLWVKLKREAETRNLPKKIIKRGESWFQSISLSCREVVRFLLRTLRFIRKQTI